MKGDQARRKKLGQAFRRRREKLLVSQEAFADQLGMHRTYYSGVERGERNITLSTMTKIADGLGTKLAEVMADAGL